MIDFRRDTPLYLAVDGIDGSGKTTVMATLAAYVRKEMSLQVEEVSEPRSTDFGLDCWDLLKLHENKLCLESQACLFFAARFDLLRRIHYLLNAGMNVFSDRSWMSTVAYQGARDPSRIPWLLSCSRTLLETNVPHKIFVVDVPVTLAVERMQASGKKLDWLEKNLDYLRDVRCTYLKLATQDNAVLIDGTGTPQDTFEQILHA